jgi:hypothetical protein
MNDKTMYFCFTLIILFSLACSSWLVIEGHPVFAFFILMAGTSVSFTHRGVR